MREVIRVVVNGNTFVLGYTCMMCPAGPREQEQGNVFKMLRLKSTDRDEEGDVLFFRCEKKLLNGELNNEWLVTPEFCFINLSSPLIDLYQTSKLNRNTSFDEVIELVAQEKFLSKC